MERRYWWVNQNQTFAQEIRGGYLWSPKRRSDNARNQFYEFMREVAPGDLIFSFYDTRIQAIGTAKSYAYECPKPVEFGSAGMNWNTIGWRVDVHYEVLPTPFRPKDRIGDLVSLLPDKYSPLQKSGDGLQGVYLASVPQPMAETLLTWAGIDFLGVASPVSDFLQEIREDRESVMEWEKHLVAEIQNEAIPETEKKSLINARIGQGLFRKKVQAVEAFCRVTKVDNPAHLIASHIKPWHDSNNMERLDGENGLLLTPSMDHLFDRGFISFKGNGDLVVSTRSDQVSLVKMGIPANLNLNVGNFSSMQKEYLEFHRDEVLLRVS
jgi:hypothetical protein